MERYVWQIAVVLGALSLFGTPRLVWAQPIDGGLTANPANVAGEGEAWGAFNDFKKQMGDLTQRDPQAAVNTMRQWFEANPKLHPIVAGVLSADIANLYREKLKQPEKAIAIYDWGLNKGFKGLPAAMIMVEGKARTLVETKRATEALELLQDQWPKLVASFKEGHPYLRGVASRSLYWRVQALQAEKKNSDVSELLQNSLSEMPLLFAPQNQLAADWSQGWIYAAIIDALLAQKQFDKALSWAKLGYAQANFDKAAIEKASGWAGSVWAAQNNFIAARNFGLAQDDATRANPLQKVALPVIQSAVLENELKALEDAQTKNFEAERASQIVTLHLALGQLRPAMEAARLLLIKRPTAPEGVQQIARVFKAADTNLVRANQFIAYLDGKGDDPLAAFFKETDAATTDAP